MTESLEERQRYIRTLIRERDMARARGDVENVAAVTAELCAIGAEGSPPAKRATKR